MKHEAQASQEVGARPEMSPGSWQRRLPGLAELWRETRGDRSITVAVLDGAADLSHPCFAGADLRVVESLVPAEPPSHHGTGVASILFGQHATGFAGLAPDCRGLIVPIYPSGEDAATACSQVDLARAISLALEHGARIINISGGQLEASGEASPVLSDAIRQCAQQGVMIVAAAGNDGCECLHVPAAVPAVLAVGAMDDTGVPIAASNWGAAYRDTGILAPGQDVAAASVGGGAALRTGTSWATPVVSAAAALLLSLQSKRGPTLDVTAVREALLGSARGCDVEPTDDCRRLLGGRLDLAGAVARLRRQIVPASDKADEADDEPVPAGVMARSETASSAATTGVVPADCSVEPETTAEPEASAESVGVVASDGPRGFVGPSQVYALGQLGYDFGSQTRRDWFVEQGISGDPEDPAATLAYLATNPAHASALTFTLLQDSTPIYVIEPSGAFAAETYRTLCELSDGMERVSVPGWMRGSARLLNGQTVPRIVPELRGMLGWSTATLVNALLGARPTSTRKKEKYEEEASEVTNFLERVWYEIRNPGLAPQERAVNFAATAALQTADVYCAVLRAGLKLDAIEVERSPVCRPESDCWDVKLTFFQSTRRLEQAREVYRLTVDVGDVVPISIGRVHHWYVY